MKSKFLLTFHEIMDSDFTGITLTELGGFREWSNTEEEELYPNQSISLELDLNELTFLVQTLELNLI